MKIITTKSLFAGVLIATFSINNNLEFSPLVAQEINPAQRTAPITERLSDDLHLIQCEASLKLLFHKGLKEIVGDDACQYTSAVTLSAMPQLLGLKIATNFDKKYIYLHFPEKRSFLIRTLLDSTSKSGDPRYALWLVDYNDFSHIQISSVQDRLGSQYIQNSLRYPNGTEIVALSRTGNKALLSTLVEQINPDCYDNYLLRVLDVSNTSLPVIYSIEGDSNGINSKFYPHSAYWLNDDSFVYNADRGIGRYDPNTANCFIPSSHKNGHHPESSLYVASFDKRGASWNSRDILDLDLESNFFKSTNNLDPRFVVSPNGKWLVAAVSARGNTSPSELSKKSVNGYVALISLDSSKIFEKQYYYPPANISISQTNVLLWTPDSSAFVYASDQFIGLVDYPSNSFKTVWPKNGEGGENVIEIDPCHCRRGWDMQISADGRFLTYLSKTNQGDNGVLSLKVADLSELDSARSTFELPFSIPRLGSSAPKLANDSSVMVICYSGNVFVVDLLNENRLINLKTAFPDLNAYNLDLLEYQTSASKILVRIISSPSNSVDQKFSLSRNPNNHLVLTRISGGD